MFYPNFGNNSDSCYYNKRYNLKKENKRNEKFKKQKRVHNR